MARVTSRVVSRTCVIGAEPPAVQSAAASAVLLKVFQDINYTTELDRYYGAEPCDESGYGIPDTGWLISQKISSFSTHSGCTYVRGYDGKNYGGNCGTFYGPQYYVGDFFNDSLRSFRVAAAYHYCY